MSNVSPSKVLEDLYLHLQRATKLLRAVELAEQHPLSVVYKSPHNNDLKDLFPLDLLELDEELTELVRNKVTAEIQSVVADFESKGITIDLDLIGLTGE